jgi:hypothetical protein
MTKIRKFIYLGFSTFFSFNFVFSQLVYAAVDEKVLDNDSRPRLQRTMESPTAFGHNLTPTSYVLPKNHFTVGAYAIAYGITDRLQVSTSPWIDLLYNMPALNVKYAFDGNEIFQQITVDGNLFKTFKFGENKNTQESFMGRVIGSHRFSENYTLHTVGGYQYFWNDERPFSLRLKPGNSDRFTLSLSTLHEFRLIDHLGFFFEAGLLGLNYNKPYLHLGVSSFVYWDWGLIQLGISQSSSLGKMPDEKYPGLDQNAHGTIFSGVDTVIHPEIQIQFYF